MAYIVRVGKHSFDLKSVTVEPVLFLYMFTSFTQFITNQALVYDKVCQYNYNATVCDNLNNDSFKPQEDVVQKHTSTWLLYINLALGIPSLVVVGMFLGPWGDRVGRKIPVIAPLFGAILSAICNILNSVYMQWPLWALLVGPMLNGMFGGYIAAMMAVYSYVACVSRTEDRTIRMGIMQSMIYMSATIGTATSGVMLDRTSYVFVFGVVCVVLVMALVYALLWVDNVIPEQTDEQDESTSWCYVLVVAAVKDVCVCVYRKRRDVNFLNLGILILIIFCLQLITVGENDILLIFTRHTPFDWSQTTYGLYKGLDSFLRGIAVITVLPLCKRKLGARDTTLIVIGLVSKAVALTFIGVGRTTAILFIGALTGVLEGFCSAVIRSMCSILVATDEQGKVFGLIGILESFAQLGATGLFNTVYKATLDVYSGLCFLLGVGIIVICIALTVWLRYRLPEDGFTRQAKQDSDVEVNNDID